MSEPQKVYLTIREYTWGGQVGEEVIGVSATEEVAENVASSFRNYERSVKSSGEAWPRGDTTDIDVQKWDVRGVVPCPLCEAGHVRSAS